MLGLVCMLLLLLLKLMRDHGPRVHPDMSPGMRLSHGLLWTATTGEGLLAGELLPQVFCTTWTASRGHPRSPKYHPWRVSCHGSGHDLALGYLKLAGWF